MERPPQTPSVLPLVAMPVAVVGGLFLSIMFGLGSFYAGRLLPFLVACWIGLGFNFAWDALKASSATTSPAVLTATALLSAIVILSMLGGIQVVWEDPWIFGVAVVPGIRIAWVSLSSRPQGKDASEAATTVQSQDDRKPE